jgi:hypothetical protein
MNLEFLSLNKCYLNDDTDSMHWKQLTQLDKLVSLDIQGSFDTLSNHVVSIICSMSNLTCLNLSGIYLSNESNTHLLLFINLTELVVLFTQIDIMRLVLLPKLTHLFFYDDDKEVSHIIICWEFFLTKIFSSSNKDFTISGPKYFKKKESIENGAIIYFSKTILYNNHSNYPWIKLEIFLRINDTYEENLEKRLFNKKDIQRKLEEQGNVCNICKERFFLLIKQFLLNFIIEHIHLS